MIVLITDLVFIKFGSEIQNIVPWYYRLVFAIPLFICGLFIALKGLRLVFGEVREPPAVVQHGPFRYSRHPIYLSAIVFYLSILIVTMSVLAIIFNLGIIVLYNYLARYEESYLIEIFGEEYLEYMAIVHRWIGRK